VALKLDHYRLDPRQFSHLMALCSMILAQQQGATFTALDWARINQPIHLLNWLQRPGLPWMPWMSTLLASRHLCFLPCWLPGRIRRWWRREIA